MIISETYLFLISIGKGLSNIYCSVYFQPIYQSLPEFVSCLNFSTQYRLCKVTEDPLSVISWNSFHIYNAFQHLQESPQDSEFHY